MIKILKTAFVLSLIYAVSMFPQGFNVKAKGMQTFSFRDTLGRNQTTFHSTTPFEDFTGMSTDVQGTVSFNVDSVVSTLKGKISISTESIQTGIEHRDKDLKSSRWLDAEDYPTISFAIKKVTNVQKLADNKLKINLLGDFTLHGVTKEIPVEATLIYLDQNAETMKREPGDLLGVTASFKITLSNYNVQNLVLGKRVSDEIPIKVNIVGTNKF